MEVLKVNGYKIGFDISFEHEGHEERQVLAYNLNYNTIIVAETYRQSFNSINVYCPNLSVFTFFKSIFSHGGGNLSVLEIHKEMEKVKREKGICWAESEDISLWNYADPTTDENGNWILWDSTIDRILNRENTRQFKTTETNLCKEKVKIEGDYPS